ncbi:hypothetical protein DERF_001020 [Dermatophagoides farinae]|uniref:Uncharacterized protein n=1 Tax=Dermatophagoides farinae TaxID=6954 RepID=A0A922IA03_DERFA|nr:hypothetical protein DERF_001020 [Dermatophagoides farinae]
MMMRRSIIITLSLLLLLLSLLLDNGQCKKEKSSSDNKFFNGDVEFVTLYYPIHPLVQLMYEQGYKGGYGTRYEDVNRGIIKNKKYRFKFYKPPPK